VYVTDRITGIFLRYFRAGLEVWDFLLMHKRGFFRAVAGGKYEDEPFTFFTEKIKESPVPIVDLIPKKTGAGENANRNW
jgi:hypothetical protein